MGKKNKRQFDEDGTDITQNDHSTGYVSHKKTLAKEAEEAKKGAKTVPSKNVDDEDKTDNKKKRGRKGAQEDDDAFGQAGDQIPTSQPDGDHDLQKDLEANFEGIGKKNTRKKKQKDAQMYGDDDLAGAFDQGADSDEIHEKKGKGGKKGKGKGKGKKQDSDAEEEVKEATKEPEKESDEEETEGGLPLKVVYCQSK